MSFHLRFNFLLIFDTSLIGCLSAESLTGDSSFPTSSCNFTLVSSPVFHEVQADPRGGERHSAVNWTSGSIVDVQIIYQLIVKMVLEKHLLLPMILLNKVGNVRPDRVITQYQSEDPSPTIPTHIRKKINGANSNSNKMALALVLKPASSTPSNTGSAR